jgi:hypothetical protein
MGKKSRGKAAKKSAKPKSDFPPSLAGATGLLIGAGLTWMVMTDSGAPNKPVRPEPTKTSPAATSTVDPSSPLGGDQDLSAIQVQALAMHRKQADALVEEIMANPDRISAEDDDQRFVFPHPVRTRWLMLTGRARPQEQNRWTASLLTAADESVRESLVVEAHFELAGAASIDSAQFNETGSVAYVLTRTHHRGQPPGDLIRLVPGENHGKIIDQDVFRFVMAPDGDAVLYERATDPKDLLGKRELKIYHASRQEGLVIRDFSFPKEQIGTLGPWDPSGVFVRVSTETYGSGFEPASVDHFTLDAFNPTKLVPVETPETEN